VALEQGDRVTVARSKYLTRLLVSLHRSGLRDAQAASDVDGALRIEELAIVESAALGLRWPER
jgi:hypothetical protein